MLSNSLLSVAVLAGCVAMVTSHGRLMEPPSRASAWRKNIPGVATNYNDNGLYCGGFNHQWQVNGGKCGVCGDPWDGPREHEAGGKYARGVITRTYTAGDVIDLHVQLTAYHKGWFEFRICANNDVTRSVTQACLDENVLPIVTSQGPTTRLDINNNQRRDYYLSVELPDGLVCDQCLIQWKYNAGNNWGTDRQSGESCVGCGPQEQFYGCSDVTILLGADWSDPRSTPVDQETAAVLDDVTFRHVSPSSTTITTPRSLTTVLLTRSTARNSMTSSTTARETTTTTTSPPNEDMLCRAVSAWKGGEILTQWCTVNCRLGFCPGFLCTCSPALTTPGDIFQGCRGTGAYVQVAGMDDWCRDNCAKNNCPASHCICP